MVLDRASFLEARQALPTLDECSVFQTPLACFRVVDGEPRMLEKTPLHLRGRRACVSSLMTDSFTSSDATVLVRQWARNVSIGKMRAAKGARQVMIVANEDLIVSPRRSMVPLFEFLGVAPSEDVLEYDREMRTVILPETSWKGNISRILMPNRADAMRTELARRSCKSWI